MAKKELVDVKALQLKLTLEKLEKSYGKGTVMTLESKVMGTYDVIPTGSLVFDYKVLGIGGFAKGKLYELMGWEGVGKSTICGHAAANCQKQGGTVVYIDGEHAVDKLYFQALGVDTNTMIFSQPSSGEEGFNVALELIRSGSVDLVIIDSDSSLLPKKVSDNEIGESAIGQKARLNSNAYPVLKNALVENQVCVIVISQYREKIGVMFGNPTTTQGGHALKFTTDVRMEISKQVAKEDGEIYGNLTKIKTIKNKMFPPYRTGEFIIEYGVGIDRIQEIVDLGVELQIIKKSGSWYSYGDTKLGQGTAGVKKLLEDNEELYQELCELIGERLRPTEEINPEDLSKDEDDLKENVEQ